MMDFIHFQHPESVHWVWVVLVLGVAGAGLIVRRQDKLNAFMAVTMQRRLLSQPSRIRRFVQLLFFVLCGVACVFALMRPQIVRQEAVPVSRHAANIYVLLDVSRSMLATDVVPSRLERAKAEIRDMLPSFTTHHVGLIAFAGRATVLSPLTMDHGFFRLVLDTASPQSVTLGGTNMGDAIRKATQFLSGHEGPKVILLVTDGEDHDSYPLEAAQEARQAGVVIVAVGFGSEAGSRIEVLDRATGTKKRVLDGAGREVVSKLDGELLRKIAMATNGVYVPAATGVLDLDDIMKRHILPLVDEANEVRMREVKVELFQWFIALGMLFFLGFILLESRWWLRHAQVHHEDREGGAA